MITKLFPKNKTGFIFSLLFLFCLLAPPLLAKGVTKDDILANYEKAVTQAENMRVYWDDTYRIMPRIRLASNALLKSDFKLASRVLDEVLFDLKLLESKKPAELTREMRLEWLEVYIEVIQKLALLAIFAFLFVKWPFYRDMLKKDVLSPPGRLALPFVVSGVSIFLSYFDLSRYGESAWSFFDVQIVLAAVCGLLGGFWAGLASGLIVGAFRWLLKPEVLVYFWMILGAGIFSGLLSRTIRTYRSTEKQGFIVGALTGLMHGLIIYLPVANFISTSYLVITIGFVALLEGAGVVVFFAVVSAFLRGEMRHEMERELLKSKLLFLQAQIRPHFLFNALNTISAIASRENALEVRALVLDLANFLRRVLKREDEAVTLRDEMEYIDSYLEIEKARFQRKLVIEKETAIPDEAWNVKIPILVLQPLVENAVKHGIGKKETPGTLRIRISASGDGFLRVGISDDGPGMSAETLAKVLESGPSFGEGAGIGLKNIRERLIRLYGREHDLKYETEPGKGTRVTICIPYGEGAKK